jgi:hypothetical protein
MTITILLNHSGLEDGGTDLFKLIASSFIFL